MLQMLAATTNKNKVREFLEILDDLKDKINITTIDTIQNFPEIIEDGTTFEENAMKKAKEASRSFLSTVPLLRDTPPLRHESCVFPCPLCEVCRGCVFCPSE